MNKETRESLFAQYWGQKVYVSGDIEFPFTAYMMDEVDYLLLKPLSMISDEDAIEVSRILEFRGDSFRPHNIKNTVTAILLKEHLYSEVDPFKMSAVIDFLRSKGYALSFRGISVEKMCEFEWIKLIEQ